MNTAAKAAIAERRAKAIELRRAGVDWTTIAKELGYSSKASACKDVRRAMEESLKLMSERAEIRRVEEVARLDRLQQGLWARAVGGDPRAADTVLRIIDRRIRLLGLDAPTEVKVRHVDNLDEEIASLERELGERQRRADVGQTAPDQGTPGADR